MSAPPRKMAILRPGALGDGVLTLPVLASLRAAWPDAELLAIGPPVLGLAVESGLATRWMRFDDPCLACLFAEDASCPVLADSGVVLAYAAREELRSSIERCTSAQVLVWPVHPPRGTHVIDHLLEVLVAWEVAPAITVPRLEAQRAWLTEGRALLATQGLTGRFAAIHPGSGGRRKCWPAERFAAVAERLKLPVVWLLGPAERERSKLRSAGQEAVAVIETPSLTALAGILAACEVYVGNDSGVTHLAAALKAATVAVFGATDPAAWAPRGPKVTTLGSPDTGGLNAVAVSDVEQAVERLMAKPKSTSENS